MKLARIFTKLFLSHASIGLLAILFFSLIFYYVMRDTIITRTTNQLASVNVLKRDRLDHYLEQTLTSLNFLFTHDFFTEHFDTKTTPLSPTNFPEGVKLELTAISTLHDLNSFAVFNNAYELIHTDHTAKASIFKNILSKVMSVPNSGQANKVNDQPIIVDASADINAGLPLVVYLVPLRTSNNSQLGWIVIEENFFKIQELLDETTGMGSSGESYLVGPDQRMRSASRFDSTRRPLDITVSTYRSADSIRSTVDHVMLDYRGVQVISFASKVKSPGLDWLIISEIDLAQAMDPVNRLRNYLIVITIVMMALVLAVTAMISNAISRPILHLKEMIMTLARGIIPATKVKVVNKGEVGEIGHAVNQLVTGMKQTADFAYAIGAGRFETPFTLLSEKDAMGQALIHMRNQLRTIHERELRLVREKTAALLEGQENERKRIVRDLHDGVGQMLTAIRLRMQMIDGGPLVLDRNGHDLGSEIMKLINDTIEEVRRISYNVMPNALVDFGLEAALRSLCDNVNTFHAKTQGRKQDAKTLPAFTVDFQYVRDSEQPIPFDISIAVFRIAQEGLNNITKHANAKSVDLHVIEKKDEIYLMLKDDGKGFVESSSHTGFGLRSMRERARLLNGSLEIETTVDGGTILELHIPLSHRAGDPVSGK
jgi:signal transduction histidine kinase